MIQQSHYRAYIWEKKKQQFEKIHAPSMFIATLFTTTRSWKQPKRPPTEEWIKKMWYMYTMEYYSAIKKKKTKIMPIAATWTDLEIITLSEASQTNTIWYHSYVESK